MLARLLMAKVFALLVAGFILLRGLILYSDSLVHVGLALGLLVALLLIWIPGRISRFLPARLGGEITVGARANPPEGMSETPEGDLTDTEPAEAPEDSGADSQSSPGTLISPVALVGWGLLMMLLAAVLFLGPAEEPALDPELDFQTGYRSGRG